MTLCGECERWNHWNWLILEKLFKFHAFILIQRILLIHLDNHKEVAELISVTNPILLIRNRLCQNWCSTLEQITPISVIPLAINSFPESHAQKKGKKNLELRIWLVIRHWRQLLGKAWLYDIPSPRLGRMGSLREKLKITRAQNLEKSTAEWEIILYADLEGLSYLW